MTPYIVVCFVLFFLVIVAKSYLTHNPGEAPRRVTALRVTQVGEYLGLPYVEIDFRDGSPDSEIEPIWCARGLVEHPVNSDNERINTTIEIMHTIAARHSIPTAGVISESLHWKDGEKNFELNFDHEALLLYMGDQNQNPDAIDIRFFTDETDPWLDTMIRINEKLLIEAGGIEDQELQDYLARIPQSLLHRIQLFCTCTGGFLMLGTEITFSAFYGAIDLELVDAFLNECMDMAAELSNLTTLVDPSQDSLW